MLFILVRYGQLDAFKEAVSFYIDGITTISIDILSSITLDAFKDIMNEYKTEPHR